MKTKVSKRLLSVLLAALLIVTSVPLMAITSFAKASDSSIAELKGQIDAYTEKMDGTVYLAMEDAYNAYIEAYKIYDAAIYGSNSVTTYQVTEAASTLKSATEAMTPWVRSYATATYKFPGDSSYYTIPTSDVKNILYAPATASMTAVVTDTTGSYWSGTKDGYGFFRGAAPSALVVLYDGNEVKIPVMTAWRNAGDATTVYDREGFGWFPNDASATASQVDNADLQLKKVWEGRYEMGTKTGDDAAKESFQWQTGQSNAYAITSTLAGYNYATSIAATETSAKQGFNASYYKSYANILEYCGGSSGFTNGLKSVKIGWTGYMHRYKLAAGLTELNKAHNYWMGTSTSNSNVYCIIDYKSALDAIESHKDLLNVTDGYYLNGELTALLQAFAKCTVDVTNSGYTESNYKTRAAAIAKTLSEGADALNDISYIEDATEGYRTLREKMFMTDPSDSEKPDTRTVYNEGNDPQKWGRESWSNFEGAYATAEAVFDALVDGDYTVEGDSNAATLADEVEIYYLALESQADFTPVDEAKEYVLGELDDYKYSVTTLQNINEQLPEFYYLNKADRLRTFADANDSIIAEAGEIRALVDNTVTLEGEVLVKALEKVRSEYPEPDAVNGLANALRDIQAIEIIGDVDVAVVGRTIKGYNYDSQQELDDEITGVLTTLTEAQQQGVQKYDVVVVDEAGNTLATYKDQPFGQEITVPSPTGKNVAWTYDYVSNTSNTDGKHEPVFLGTKNEVSFVVAGNTTLTIADGSTKSNPVKLTYRTSQGYTYKIEYVEKSNTAINLNEDDVPNYAFYYFDKFTVNGTKVTKITPSADTVIVAEYTADAKPTYEVYDFTIGDEEPALYYYNELVDFDEEYAEEMLGTSAYVWVEVYDSVETVDDFYNAADDSWNLVDEWGDLIEDPDEIEALTPKIGRVVHYGPSYAFRVSKDVKIIALDYDTYYDYAYYIIEKNFDENGAVVYTNENINNTGIKLDLISQFAIPDEDESGCKVAEVGIIAQVEKDASTTDTELIAANVGTDNIYRFKSSPENQTSGGQYRIGINYTSPKANGVNTLSIKYRAYMNYYDADGVLHTVYSDTYTHENVSIQ